MRLNHMNLVVGELDAASRFFVDFFDFTEVDRKGRALVILQGADGFSLVLSDPTKFGGPPPDYHSAFHIGFQVASNQDVDAQHARLRDGGLELAQEPASNHGAYGFYFSPFDGLVIEVATT